MKAVVAALLSLGALSGLAVAYGGFWPYMDGLCAMWWGLWAWLGLLERKARRPRWTEEDMKLLESWTIRLPGAKEARR